MGMGVGKGREIHEEDGNETVRRGEGPETGMSKRARERDLGTASHDKERYGGTVGNSRPPVEIGEDN